MGAVARSPDRRAIERVSFEVRTEIANICQNGEPPLSEQG